MQICKHHEHAQGPSQRIFAFGQSLKNDPHISCFHQLWGRGVADDCLLKFSNFPLHQTRIEILGWCEEKLKSKCRLFPNVNPPLQPPSDNGYFLDRQAHSMKTASMNRRCQDLLEYIKIFNKKVHCPDLALLKLRTTEMDESTGMLDVSQHSR